MENYAFQDLLVEPTCCMKCIEYYIQEVADDDGDVRCGTYLLHEMYTNTTNNATAVEAGCHDGCIYTKMNDRSGIGIVLKGIEFLSHTQIF